MHFSSKLDCNETEVLRHYLNSGMWCTRVSRKFQPLFCNECYESCSYKEYPIMCTRWRAAEVAAAFICRGTLPIRLIYSRLGMKKKNFTSPKRKHDSLRCFGLNYWIRRIISRESTPSIISIMPSCVPVIMCSYTRW